MADGDDFTFCRVEKPVDGVEDQHVAVGIGGIRIDDKNANGSQDSGSIWKAGVPSQKTVGTLTFNVIDASTQEVMNERPKLDLKEVAGSTSKEPLEQKTLVKKPMPRRKVPYEIGYSPLDWLKLTRTHPDLAGSNGQSNRRLITMDEVKQHKSEDSMWTALKGHVYNIGPYMKFHPGGEDMLKKAVGRNSTLLFSILYHHLDKHHAWVNAEVLLEKCLVGILDETK
ncbi:cytochrome b5 domain-containing protein RLF-like isoform X1 [Primulina tabacum]|uniref:cytochrome b5 domain-containing protein RLF-like isoform X1 n=1 Tax=Primulina tabacum TaxID=48773 RepID=UPI003F5A508E